MTQPLTPEARAMFEPVLTWLDAGAPHTNGVGFNMDQFRALHASDYANKDCGAACCIAGALAQFNGLNTKDYVEGVGEQLGMSDDDVRRLFYADNGEYAEDCLHCGNMVGGDLSIITPTMAAATIRHFLATGEVEWANP